MKRQALAVLVATALVVAPVAANPPPRFPAGAVWHQDISSAPLHANSASQISALAGLGGFGNGRMDGWRYDYRGAWVYRDANYGYRGFYVSQGEYNYYFREGFRRGYEDGYYARYRYGRNYNGSEVILGTVLSGILNLQAYRW